MFSGILTLAMSSELLKAQNDMAEISRNAYGISDYKVVTWDVSSRGDVNGNLDEFKTVVENIYNDPRGWIRAGVKFEYVESGGQLHVVLASPADVEAFSPTGCSTEWSCTVRPYVIINDDRWMGATVSYQEAGESLLNYRRMVVNHETGHWLGHDHITSCTDYENWAPIMMQQSIDLRGCKANPWPTESELWTSTI